MDQDAVNTRSMEIKLEELCSATNIETSIETMTELFKELRQKCTSKTFRQEILVHPNIFYLSIKVMSKVTSNKNLDTVTDNDTSLKEKVHQFPMLNNEVVSFLVLVMQFLSNAIVQSPPSQLALWQYSKHFLGNLVCYPESRLQEVIGAIIYYIFKGCPSCQEEIVQTRALMTVGISLLRTTATEFWYIFFEYMVAEGTHFGVCFYNLTSDDKLTIIELVENVLDDDTSEYSKSQKTNIPVSTDVITCFINEFNKNSDLILVTTAKGPKDVNPVEVVNLLRLLCKVSANPNYMQQVQNNKSLLINCVYLLRALHDASCDPTSSVASVKKIEDTIKERPRLETSSTYGLKGDMIRMVGNLMHKNKENQNFVLENKAIEIILESTCYDGRNPLMKEWSILAIRNFCDGNECNQRYIGNLQKRQVPEDYENKINRSTDDTSNLKNAVEFFKHLD